MTDETTETPAPRKRGRPRKNPEALATAPKESTAITLAPALKEELDAVRLKAQQMLQWATSCPLGTLEEVANAESRLAIVWAATKKIAARKLEVCGPGEALLELQQAAFRPIEECLASCTKAMKARLHERVQESRAVREQALAEGNHALAHEPVLQVQAIQERTEWNFTIINANLIGQKWWTIDVEAIPPSVFDRLREIAKDALVLNHAAVLAEVRKNKSNQGVGAGIQATSKKVAAMAPTRAK